jgi:hypothetical protein
MIDMTSEEDLALERYAGRLAGQGYRLVKQPRGPDLPPFLGSYRPDAILVGPRDGILVEVVRKGQSDAVSRVEALRALINDHPAWRLEVLYAGVQPESLTPVSPSRIRDTVRQIAGLNKPDAGAFLLLWATLEATARSLVPEETKRPQSPGRVVELLASSGRVPASDADYLRQLAKLRNRLIHGDLDVEIPAELFVQMLEIVSELTAQLDVHERRSH